MGLIPRKPITKEVIERDRLNIAALRDYVLPEDQDEKKRAEDEPARIEKNFLEVKEAFENASKHPAPKYPTAGTAEALAYWGGLARRKIQEGGGAYDLAMSRAAVCALKLGKVNEHPEWLGTTQKGGKVKYINIEALEKCYMAYSPCVSAAVRYVSETPKLVDFEGKRCCDNHFLCAFDQKKYLRECEETAALIMRYAENAGYRAIMGALTLPHWYGKNEVESVEGIGECLRRVVKSRRWRRLEAKYGISDLGVVNDLPYIRGFEQTLGGNNGGHYHFHFILWYKGKAKDADDIISVFRALWIEYAVERLHLVPSESEDPIEYNAFANEHGFKACYLRKSKTAAAVNYVTKLNSWTGAAKSWGALSELTRQDLKVGKKGKGLTPGALLAKISMIDAPLWLETRDPSVWAVLMRDVEDYCKYAGATRSRKLIDTSNGLKTWAEAQRQREESKQESKETLFGFHGCDFAYLVNHGIIPEIKKAILTGSECVARVIDYLENDLHMDIWDPARIAQLRANEEIKAAEYRCFRKQKAKLQKDFRAAAADPDVTLKTAFSVLSAWEYREFLRIRGEILAPPPIDENILLLPAPPREIGLFDNLRVKNDAAGG